MEAAAEKPHAFVAMPFKKPFKDTFHYAIQRPVQDSGLLCEVAYGEHFTGDIMTWVMGRIRSAEIVIADVSTANPNVFLEVGLAWGANRPTILIAQEGEELPFDVQGQRVHFYPGMIELE